MKFLSAPGTKNDGMKNIIYYYCFDIIFSHSPIYLTFSPVARLISLNVLGMQFFFVAIYIEVARSNVLFTDRLDVSASSYIFDAKYCVDLSIFKR